MYLKRPRAIIEKCILQIRKEKAFSTFDRVTDKNSSCFDHSYHLYRRKSAVDLILDLFFSIESFDSFQMILYLIAFILFTYIVLFYRNVRKYPKGPFPLPLIGNLYHVRFMSEKLTT